MAKFSKGQRVKATSGREGVITFVALPTTVSLPTVSAGETRSAFVQGYVVRFDGDDKPQDMGERELEAA
ncbi:MAG: hypothetical protein NZ936_12920 [Alphaproteobacteria bacterium]|nr:hypothetical protein [Alphaproteobacteria bacterium]